MKTIITFAFCIGLLVVIKPNSVLAQPYVTPLSIIPSNPTPNDSVYIATKVGLYNSGTLIGSQYTISNDTINIISCYWVGVQTAPIDIYDTLNLGLLSSGEYHIKFNAYISFSYPGCTYDELTVRDTSFSVGFTNLKDSPKQVEKKLIKIVDILGNETEDKPNTLLIFIYSDGTTEKVFRME